MESLCQKVNRYAYDTIDLSDTVTYSAGKAQAEFRGAVEEFEDSLKEIVILLGDHIPPKGSDDDPVYKYWRKGACFAASQDICDNYKYELDIGYTKALGTSGLEYQILTFIKAAKDYLDNKEYLQGKDSRSFKLIEKLNSKFYEEKPPSFSVIIREFNKYADKSTITATVALFSLATGVFITFGIYYYIGFVQASKRFSSSNRLLICLCFAINQADRLKYQELNTFIESSGASVN
jgi:hypothetical protein